MTTIDLQKPMCPACGHPEIAIEEEGPFEVKAWKTVVRRFWKPVAVFCEECGARWDVAVSSVEAQTIDLGKRA